MCPFLVGSTQDQFSSSLIDIKTKGNLLYPLRDVIIIAQTTERTIRANDTILFTHKNAEKFLTMKSFQAVSINCSGFTDNTMTEHIKQQGIIDNHKTQLIKTIIL